MNGIKKGLSGALGLIIAIGLIVFVYKHPTGAGQSAGDIFDWFGSVGDAIGAFFASMNS